VCTYRTYRALTQNLPDYCADDVRILCNLHRKKTLVNPRTNKTLELEEFSHPHLYPMLASLEEDEMEANEAADAAAELEATAAAAAETTTPDAADAESAETQAALAADALAADAQAALAAEAAPAGAPGRPAPDSLHAVLHAALAARDAAKEPAGAASSE